MSEAEPRVARARIFAIVPAAGRSRRMGAAKQLLPVAGRPMLESVVEPLVHGGLNGVLVVMHAGLTDALAPLLDRLGAIYTFNDDPASAMIDSLRCGLAAWRRLAAPGAGDGFLVCPGDQPGLAERHIAACAAAFRGDPTRIVIAAHGGRRGHPMIFPAALAADVESAACDGGLRELARAHEGLVKLIELDSAAATRNINTPADYESL